MLMQRNTELKFQAGPARQDKKLKAESSRISTTSNPKEALSAFNPQNSIATKKKNQANFKVENKEIKNDSSIASFFDPKKVNEEDITSKKQQIEAQPLETQHKTKNFESIVKAGKQSGWNTQGSWLRDIGAIYGKNEVPGL